eukprot:1824819-Lingulodinium_polyedra.AAC.1
MRSCVLHSERRTRPRSGHGVSSSPGSTGPKQMGHLSASAGLAAAAPCRGSGCLGGAPRT